MSVSLLSNAAIMPVSSAESSEAAKSLRSRAIASRWTPALTEKGGFTPVIDPFLNCYAALGITSTEAMFLIHLLSHKWDEKMPFPGMNGIAAKMGVSDTSVRNYARDLEQKGFLKRRSRPGKTTMFDLNPLFNALEQELAKTQNKPTRLRRTAG